MALIHLIKLIAQKDMENYLLLLQMEHPKAQRGASNSLDLGPRERPML